MANDNLFFKKLAEVHPRFGTPAAAVLALGIWSAVLAAFGGFVKLANGAIFIGWIFYGLGAASYFPDSPGQSRQGASLSRSGLSRLRRCFLCSWRSPLSANPIYAAIKDPGQFTYLLVAIALLLLGLPAYFFWSRRQNNPQ